MDKSAGFDLRKPFFRGNWEERDRLLPQLVELGLSECVVLLFTQGGHSPGGPEYHVTGPVRPLPVAPVGPYVCALYGDFSYLVFRRLKNLWALPGTWVQLHF